MNWRENGGHYLLVLRLESPTKIRVGRLGSFSFQQGTYCYAGRAKRNLRQRIARHWRREKPARWHVDYLTPHLQPAAVLLFSLEETAECELARLLVEAGGRRYPPRFGASDCRCPGHLVWFGSAEPGRVLAALGLEERV